MIKIAISIATLCLLATCGPTKPCDGYPVIGSCKTGALSEEAGGPCNGGECGPGLACASGLCYPCGHVADPPEPCCGEGPPNWNPNDPAACPGSVCAKDNAALDWFTCGTGAPNTLGCSVGQQQTFVTGVIDDKCNNPPVPNGICTSDPTDQMTAQMLADARWGAFHGPVVAAGQPIGGTSTLRCGKDADPNDGVDCILGMASEINGTTFFYFTPAQLTACEANVDSACDFSLQAVGGTCPAM